MQIIHCLRNEINSFKNNEYNLLNNLSQKDQIIQEITKDFF